MVKIDIGIWTNIKETGERNKWGHKIYSVECKYCGKKFKMTMKNIKRAKKCLHIRLNIKDTRLRKIFYHMKLRCYNENDKDYKTYGARGVHICEEWLNDPKSFETWAFNNGYKEDLTIDRIDFTKNYCPSNCRWISLQDNARYKSTTRLINVDGEILSGRQWSERLGRGINFINTYFRVHGEENTINYIRNQISPK